MNSPTEDLGVLDRRLRFLMRRPIVELLAVGSVGIVTGFLAEHVLHQRGFLEQRRDIWQTCRLISDNGDPDDEKYSLDLGPVAVVGVEPYYHGGEYPIRWNYDEVIPFDQLPRKDMASYANFCSFRLKDVTLVDHNGALELVFGMTEEDVEKFRGRVFALQFCNDSSC